MIALMVSLWACSAPEPVAPPAPERLDLRAASYPAWWLVRTLVEDDADLTLVIPPGVDPPDWQPDGELVASLADADLVVANGYGYEAWMETASLPEGKVVYTAAKVPPNKLSGPTHSHGKQGEHSHAGLDPHTWMDPDAYAMQARVVEKAVVKLRPELAESVGARHAALDRELGALGEAFDAAVAGARGRKLLANHPAFQYFGRRFGLQITPLALDPDQVPSEAELAQIAALVEGVDDPVLLWEAPPAAAVTEALPGLRHVVIDPLEQPGPDGAYDYLAQAQADVAAWAAAFPVAVDEAVELSAPPRER